MPHFKSLYRYGEFHFKILVIFRAECLPNCDIPKASIHIPWVLLHFHINNNAKNVIPVKTLDIHIPLQN